MHGPNQGACALCFYHHQQQQQQLKNNNNNKGNPTTHGIHAPLDPGPRCTHARPYSAHKGTTATQHWWGPRQAHTHVHYGAVRFRGHHHGALGGVGAPNHAHVGDVPDGGQHSAGKVHAADGSGARGEGQCDQQRHARRQRQLGQAVPRALVVWWVTGGWWTGRWSGAGRRWARAPAPGPRVHLTKDKGGGRQWPGGGGGGQGKGRRQNTIQEPRTQRPRAPEGPGRPARA
jgi:hypothetical protein